MQAHESLKLHTTPEKFYIEACDVGTDDVLVIDRVSTEVTLTVKKDIPPSAVTRTIYGILGTLRLVAGMYLIVITKKKKVGDLFSHSIWKATDFDILSYKRTMLHLTDNQLQDNKVFLTMISHVLSVDGFYFSTSYDLTHTLQRLSNTSPEFQEMSLLERADQRFVWNGHLLREFAAQPEIHRFAIPVIHGFVAMHSCSINGKYFDWILISRRSCFRAGVRYYVRGIDSEGHAANFVETEQIIHYNGNKASFVQTRGSIPFFWSQRPNLRYKPKPQINKTVNHEQLWIQEQQNVSYTTLTCLKKTVMAPLKTHAQPSASTSRTNAFWHITNTKHPFAHETFARGITKSVDSSHTVKEGTDYGAEGITTHLEVVDSTKKAV